MDCTITICFLSARETDALADEHSCNRADLGPGIYVVFDNGTLPRGPYPSVSVAAQSLV